MTTPHFHKDEQGQLVKCYHKTRAVLSDYGFWLGVTVSFPLEHWLWHSVPPFKYIAEWVGL